MTEEEEQETPTFSKEEVEQMLSDKTSELTSSFDEKISAIENKFKPLEKPAGEVEKYVDEKWVPDTYNDLMNKTVEILLGKGIVPTKESIKSEIMADMKADQEKEMTQKTESDKALQGQIAEIKTEHSLSDKQVTEIIVKANEYNSKYPNARIGSMELAHSYWKANSKEEAKPRIPGAPSNMEEQPKQQIYKNEQDAMAAWLQEHGE